MGNAERQVPIVTIEAQESAAQSQTKSTIETGKIVLLVGTVLTESGAVVEEVIVR